tara:strand:+ start:462 stop:1499 length:1038 start_codon:yes stop_codon:yes gene_type:complete
MKNICLVRLSAIGDVCNVTAVARSIKKNHPNAKITWIIGKVESTLVKNIEDIEFIIFDKDKGIREYFNVYRKLKNKRYDVALLLHASVRANLISLMLRASIKIGYDRERARDLQWLISNRKISRTSGKHVLEAMFDFLSLIDIKENSPCWELPLSSKNSSNVEPLLSRKRINVVLSPFSSQRFHNFRNWNNGNYAKIIDYLIEKYDCKVFITGDNSDLVKKSGDELASLCKYKVVNLIGKTTLEDLVILIKNTNLVISPDSAAVHISVAMNTPVIGLYASSNPKRTGPYKNESLTVNAYPKACIKYFGKTEDKVTWGKRIRNRDVMNLIKTEDVKEKIDFFFSEN